MALPIWSVYVPDSHEVQVCPSVPLKPWLHWHSVFAFAPGGDTEFVGHSVHEVKASAVLYLPDAHKVHAKEELAPPYFPGIQFSQSSSLVAPGVDKYFPAKHATHLLSAPLPTVPAYLPAAHGVHIDDEPAPLVAEKVPCGQF
jgi:hypothetical protein